MKQEVKTAKVISVKEWMVNLIIMCIPVVNIVFLFIWAFGKKDINETKKNWAKGTLLLAVIIFGVIVLLYTLMALTGIALLGLGGNL